MVLLRMLMQSPRTECRAQPAGVSPATAEAASLRNGETAARTTLQVAKNNLRKKTTANNRKRTMVFRNSPAPLRRQRTAESTNHADKSRNPCHSGSAVFGCKDSRFRRRLSLSVHFLHGCHHVSRAVGPHIRTPEHAQSRGRSIPAENRHLTATNDQKKHVATPAGGLTEKAIRHRRTKINHYLRAAYTPIKPSCSNTIS